MCVSAACFNFKYTVCSVCVWCVCVCVVCVYAMTNDTFVDFLMFMNHFIIIFLLVVSF